MSLHNERRLVAAEIIDTLFQAEETGQIQLLLMQCSLSVKHLAPDDYAKWIENEAKAAETGGKGE